MRVMKYTDRGLILPVETKVAGKYKIQVYRPDGRCRHNTGWFDNFVTDAGLNLMGAGGYLDACQVGSGTTAPAVTDTSLVSFVAGTTTIENVTDAAQATEPYFSTRTLRWRFAAGAAEGNLSEVGIGTGAANGDTLFSRALITDSNGDPTTLTVLADEFLDVTYQIQSVPPTTDSTFNVTDSGPAGTVHSFTLRAMNVTSASANGWAPPDGNAIGIVGNANRFNVGNGTLGDITTEPGGDNGGDGSISNTAYANNSLEKVGSSFWGLNQGNVAGGINWVYFEFDHGGGTWKASISPAIPKTNTDTLNIDVKTSWTRTTAL